MHNALTCYSYSLPQTPKSIDHKSPTITTPYKLLSCDHKVQLFTTPGKVYVPDRCPIPSDTAIHTQPYIHSHTLELLKSYYTREIIYLPQMLKDYYTRKDLALLSLMHTYIQP